MVELRRFPAFFFRTEAGNEPVREWLRSLPREERRVIGLDLQRLEHRWPVGMPLSRPLGEGLHELRSNLPGGRTARLLFFAAAGELIVVAGFLKKTGKTPKVELDRARARMRTWERGA